MNIFRWISMSVDPNMNWVWSFPQVTSGYFSFWFPSWKWHQYRFTFITMTLTSIIMMTAQKKSRIHCRYMRGGPWVGLSRDQFLRSTFLFLSPKIFPMFKWKLLTHYYYNHKKFYIIFMKKTRILKVWTVNNLTNRNH